MLAASLRARFHSLFGAISFPVRPNEFPVTPNKIRCYFAVPARTGLHFRSVMKNKGLLTEAAPPWTGGQVKIRDIRESYRP
jgi:hypothetical protein